MAGARRAGALACVGAGPWGRQLVRNFAELGALAMVCEVDQGARDRLKADHPHVALAADHRTALADPEIGAVAIATPAATHGALVRAALGAGKDVFVEKPLCLTVAEGRELVALARQRERVLMVGHLLWYHPAIRTLKALVDAGELGQLQYVYSNRLNLGRVRREESILWSFAPHDVSVLLGLVGEMPDEVRAQAGHYLRPAIADVTVSLLSFPGGVKAHVFVSWLHPFKEHKLVVVGSRRMAVFDDVEPRQKLTLHPHSIEWRQELPTLSRAEAEVVPFDPVEPLRAECLHFLECLETRGRPETDGEEALRVLTVLEQCERALGPGPGSAPRSAPPPRYTAHASAFIDEDVEIGEGTTIWHVSHLMRGARIGRNCRIGQNVVVGPNVTIGNGVKIQNNVSVYEGVTLEDGVFCGPSAVFTNVVNPRSEIPRMAELQRTLVRQGASLGANCTILCGLTIGRYAFVGAGAVVTRDVPDHALVVGNPARRAGWVCRCGVRLESSDGSLSCPACGSAYPALGDGPERS